MNDYDDSYPMSLRLSLSLSFALVMGWLAVSQRFPLLWAIGTTIGFLFGSGFFTAKIIFGIRNNWRALAWSPVMGGFWIAVLAAVIYGPRMLGF